MEELQLFCKNVRTRSKENNASVELLNKAGLYGNTMSIIRQELDSLIRVIYLLKLKDSEYRKQLIHQTITGKRWTEKGKTKKIFDVDMVETVDTSDHWMKDVYKFGCKFIHLSDLHTYLTIDPFLSLDPKVKESIIRHLKSYHPPCTIVELDFEAFKPYLLKIFIKVTGYLETYLTELEKIK
jgi:hypothetical protein